MESRAMTPPLFSWRGKQLCRSLPLGILQIVFGVVLLIVGTMQYIDMSKNSNADQYAKGYPILGGLMIHIPAGIMAIVSVTAPVYVRPCMNIVSMVMSILAGCVAVGNIGWAAGLISNLHYAAHEGLSTQSTVIAVSIALLVIDILTVVFTACNLVDLKSPMQYSPIPLASTQGYFTTTDQPVVVSHAHNPPKF